MATRQEHLGKSPDDFPAEGVEIFEEQPDYEYDFSENGYDEPYPSDDSDSSTKSRKPWLKIAAPFVVLSLAAGGYLGLKGGGESKKVSAASTASSSDNPNANLSTSSQPTETSLVIELPNPLDQGIKSPEYATDESLTQDNIQSILQKIYDDLAGSVRTGNEDFLKAALNYDDFGQAWIDNYKNYGQSIRITYENDHRIQPYSQEVTQVSKLDTANNNFVEFLVITHSTDWDNSNTLVHRNVNTAEHMTGYLVQKTDTVVDPDTHEPSLKTFWVLKGFKTVSSQELPS